MDGFNNYCLYQCSCVRQSYSETNEMQRNSCTPDKATRLADGKSKAFKRWHPKVCKKEEFNIEHEFEERTDKLVPRRSFVAKSFMIGTDMSIRTSYS